MSNCFFCSSSVCFLPILDYWLFSSVQCVCVRHTSAAHQSLSRGTKPLCIHSVIREHQWHTQHYIAVSFGHYFHAWIKCLHGLSVGRVMKTIQHCGQFLTLRDHHSENEYSCLLFCSFFFFINVCAAITRDDNNFKMVMTHSLHMFEVWIDFQL